MAGLRLATTSW